jgi:hypothetical protein
VHDNKNVGFMRESGLHKNWYDEQFLYRLIYKITMQLLLAERQKKSLGPSSQGKAGCSMTIID